MMKTDECDQMMGALAGSTPEVDLAKGVLIQAKRDLRRFREARDPVGRHMYRDAYKWVMSNDFSWPYSFLNVCAALGLTPDVLRDDLFAEQPGWCARSRRAAQKLSTAFRESLASFFYRAVAPGIHVARLSQFQQLKQSTIPNK